MDRQKKKNFFFRIFRHHENLSFFLSVFVNVITDAEFFFHYVIINWSNNNEQWTTTTTNIGHFFFHFSFVSFTTTTFACFTETTFQSRNNWTTHFNDSFTGIDNSIGTLFYLKKKKSKNKKSVRLLNKQKKPDLNTIAPNMDLHLKKPIFLSRFV